MIRTTFGPTYWNPKYNKSLIGIRSIMSHNTTTFWIIQSVTLVFNTPKYIHTLVEKCNVVEHIELPAKLLDYFL